MSQPTTKVNSPSSKTERKVSEGVSDNESVNIKSNFPKKKLIIASGIMLIGIFLAYFTSYIAQPNPTPFDRKFELFSLKSWVQPIEENGIYRVTIVNTTSPITEYAVVGEQLALTFESGQAQSIMPQGNLSVIKQENNEQLSAQLNINFGDNNNDQMTNSIENSIDQFFKSIPAESKRLKINLSGYVGRTTYVEQTQPIKKNNEKQQFQQQAYSPPPTELDSFTPEYALVIGDRFVRVVKTYIQGNFNLNNIEGTSYGAERHYTNEWKDGVGAKNGVLIEINYEVESINWQRLDASKTVITIQNDSNGKARWEVVDGNIFNYIDGEGNKSTVAALATAYFSIHPEIWKINPNKPALQIDTVLPSPQLYPSVLSLLILVVFSFLSLRTLRVTNEDKDLSVVTEQQIIDNFISDAPANDTSQDQLGFVEISKALSSFLRNTGTKAPLTLVISGVWGCGKSSLMYFLKQNLESYRLRPVWINAWHHQNEEQFLAGLLNSVQSNAIPQVWTSAGLLYRWNLFKMRWSESPLMYVVASLFFFGSLSYWLTLQDFNFEVSKNLTFTDNWQNITAFITTLIGGIPLLLASMDKISTMVRSSNPIRLLIGSPGRNLDLRSNVGLREKFAKEFNMLCKALGDTTLTIFIDDLDRCKESRIMDVMETLNYLVSSGDCYIVLGMEREPVEKAIINYYRNTHEDLSPEELQLKATRYLEKIINIEIPVPVATPSQVSSLTASVKSPKNNASAKWNWSSPLLFFLALSASIILGTYLAGVVSIDISETEQTSAITSSMTEPAQPSIEKEENNNSEKAPIGELSETKFLWSFEKPKQQRNYINFILPFLIVGIVALIIRLERYRQRKQVVEKDSVPFLKAIAVWAQALGTSSHTPRSIKRYVNRARYLAMRNIASSAGIKEENLVTLAALLEFADQNNFQDFDSLKSYVPHFENEGFEQDIKVLLAKSENITEEKKRLFLHWVKGIQVN
ncbi:KAP family P-loop NTPase fold protein [Candidatus Colwellia aromaticivorans]|uniref:KAP family P-loop NTPase fold protein n=1 Tax=Candidatus Colwellia aromaticivorans TaxID=2267621 RepID=UPI00144425B3|nr:P-loop NTPase fold protein [Candidatus Colwellia aromaticivorans]